ncbi:MAG: OmpA family protein [Gammaproteobacteria bacterium]|nr:OmpA family protein [Gammaproteobacteria bacterium]NVK87809.1 OmpA family protein [Gammaproteobacteria bacterium]
MKHLILGVLMSVAVCANADFRTYLAEIDESSWTFEGNPVQCHLRHSIPTYGEAEFFARASRTPNMFFILDSKRNRLKTGAPIEVRALASQWHPGKRARQLDGVYAVPGEKTLNIGDEGAWKLLVSLEQGMNPAFFYRDFEDKSDRVAIALSAVNFKAVYDSFLNCVESLLPYDFREIQYTMVHFDFDRSKLSQSDMQKLDVLAEFIKYDPDIQVVLVEGHTDSIAFRRYNKKLGQRRANEVKAYLAQKGVSQQKILTASHGERRPLESNHTEEGRAMNRRVFITLQKGAG